VTEWVDRGQLSDEYRRTLRAASTAAALACLGLDVLQRQLDEDLDAASDPDEVLASVQASVARLRDHLQEQDALSGVTLGPHGCLITLRDAHQRTG
jgi:hypothetical protein